ncbi:MAG: long-chain fatty acid--CoA ligase [Bacteroidia bacterium]|nr:long-chain fatty acid--CoA ligase [Bacteroidia bacterium]
MVTKTTSVDFTRIFDILNYQKEKYPNQHALNSFFAGQWHGISIQELQNRIDALSCWFIGNGYQKGDKIILVPNTGSPEWMILDFACQQAGLITVPVHPTSRPEEIELILTETEAKHCVTADSELYFKFTLVIEKLESKTIIHHLKHGVPGYFFPLQISKTSQGELTLLEEIKMGIQEDELITILYTSGSSGIPKGVMLSHRNIVHGIKAILTILPLEPKHRVLSFLPFSHILERATSYAYLAFGVSLYFSQNKESFVHDFKTVKPFFCTCVPRVLEKMYDFMQEQMLHRNKIKKIIIGWSLGVGKKYATREHTQLLFTIKLFIARTFVLNLWRKKLGGKIRYMAVGAASLRPEIGSLFSAAGINIAEGYGMTETAPLITINRFEPGLNRFGTVGVVIQGTEVKIDEPNEQQEGEILVKGPNVMMGYFNRPDLTKEVFTEDGWFRTGDIGKFVYQRFLKITDRKKDIFKTSSGKYIAPLPLENHFTKSPFIQRCLVIGFQRQFVTSLIVPHFEILEAWCGEENIHWTSPQFMVHNIKVRAKFQKEVNELNEELPNVERVKDFVICHQEWNVESGEITATLKPVRKTLLEHYEKEIEKMYA